MRASALAFAALLVVAAAAPDPLGAKDAGVVSLNELKRIFALPVAGKVALASTQRGEPCAQAHGGGAMRRRTTTTTTTTTTPAPTGLVQRAEQLGTMCPIGVLYTAGDGCSTCFCNGDGRVTPCSRDACPAPRGNYSNLDCVPGETYRGSDGCNHCKCNKFRRFAYCTRNPCTGK